MTNQVAKVFSDSSCCFPFLGKCPFRASMSATSARR